MEPDLLEALRGGEAILLELAAELIGETDRVVELRSERVEQEL